MSMNNKKVVSRNKKPKITANPTDPRDQYRRRPKPTIPRIKPKK
jgi:hypothetical protein